MVRYVKTQAVVEPRTDQAQGARDATTVMLQGTSRMSQINIEVFDEETDQAVPTWLVAKSLPSALGGSADWNFDDFLNEEHHRYYGRPWYIGRTYFDFLVNGGWIAPNSNVLDIGCGAGRLGVWLIDYLQADRYFGSDCHMKSLQAFAQYEIPLHGLAHKRPRLALDGRCQLHRFGVSFDAILDLFVSAHFSEANALKLYGAMATVLRPDGRIFVPHAPVMPNEQLAECGLMVVDTAVRDIELLQRSPRYQDKARDHWHIIAHL